MKGETMGETFYVDPIKEAHKYGIKVVADSPTNPILKNYESGLIKRDGDNIVIYVNPNDSLERQRFTIAHELGHYVCGHLNNNNIMFRDSTKQYSKYNYDLKEYEANKFAAEFLMPKEKIDFLIYSAKQTTIEELAYSLIVSPTAMRIRLQNLGYISDY